MISHNIGLSSLKVFLTTYKTQSMSKAAMELNMTQPGVSQHIRMLEDNLDLSLFDRVGRKIVPTSHGRELYEDLADKIVEIDTVIERIANSQNQVQGTLNIGIPIEFGNNIILPLISRFNKDYPLVNFNINYDHAARQVDQLLNGSLDFAITDAYSFPQQIEEIKLTEEKLVLCCAKSFAQQNNLHESSGVKEITKKSFISYLPGSPVIKQWFQYHYNKSYDISSKATLMDVEGVYKLISLGMGMGILPMHIIKKKGMDDDLIIFKGKKDIMTNEISLAVLKSKTMSLAGSKFMSYLIDSFQK
jgi:DNA-binding transcriptional LysR family regulator